jgi:uncharacterized protein YkwD
MPIDRVMPASRREFLVFVLGSLPSAWPGDAHAAVAAAYGTAAIERHVFLLTNQQRTRHGLVALGSSDALAGIARGHSHDMLTRGFFDHRTPEGLGPGDRIARHGLRLTKFGENIYSITGGTADSAALASVIVTGWMNSRGHRRNILDPGFRTLGVGVAAGGRCVLATQLFGG